MVHNKQNWPNCEYDHSRLVTLLALYTPILGPSKRSHFKLPVAPRTFRGRPPPCVRTNKFIKTPILPILIN